MEGAGEEKDVPAAPAPAPQTMHWTRGSGRRIIVGVCAREKKAKSKAMNEILSRLDNKKFEVLIFGDKCILHEPPGSYVSTHPPTHQPTPNSQYLIRTASSYSTFPSPTHPPPYLEKWPYCDALIAFYSTGFPLDKAEQYAELVKPYILNDLPMQRVLMERR